MENHKIYSYIDQVIDIYNEPVNLLDGLTFDHKDTLSTIEFYSNNQYKSGNRDSLGREKPFYNICNFRVTVAKTATDLDVKDLRYEPDSLKDSVASMLINKELFKYLKETNFSETLNDMGKTRPKYGGVLIKKKDDMGKLKIDVVEWKNVTVDPVDILGGAIIETHYLLPSEIASRSDVWYNTDEVLEAFNKHNKNKPGRIEVKEVSGEFPESFDPNTTKDKEDGKYARMCFYVACIGKKKYLLYFEREKETKYKYLPWEKVPGRALGKGIVEEGFEAQVWVNDSMISMKNAMELSGKVVLSTDSQKVSGNALTGVDNGHIFQIEPGRSITSLNLSASSLPEFQNTIELWNQQYDRTSSTFNANTGEAPTAGTPYSQTALLNQVANNPFEYQREVWGIFLNEVLNDWILPYLKKKIIREHILVSDFDEGELEQIDEAIMNKNHNAMVKAKLLQGEVPTEDDEATVSEDVNKLLNSYANKREIKIPKDFLNIEGKITANITGELKNKSAVLQSLDSIMKTIAGSFNPNTGTFAILEDPVLSKIFGQIVEMSGIPLSFSQLKGRPTGSDVSSVQPVQPEIGAIQPVA